MGSVTDKLLSTEFGGGEAPQTGRVTERLLSSSVGDMPLGSVMTEIEEERKPAGFGAQFKAGFVDAPLAKVQIYSAARFPELPREERLKRYGLHKGEVVFMADDGKVYYETPDTKIDRFARFLVQEAVTKSPEWLSATITAAVTKSPWLTGLASAGGEAVRKGVGNLIFGEDFDAIDWMGDIGLAGASGTGGEYVGKGAAALIKRGGRVGSGEVGRLAQQDIGRAGKETMEATLERGKKAGVDLTLPEIAESPTITGVYKSIRGTPGEAGEKIRAFEKGVREPQLHKAIEGGLEEVAPLKGRSTAELADAGVEASKGARRSIEKARASLAEPYYTAARKSKARVHTRGIIADLDKRIAESAGSVRKALASIREDFFEKEMVGVEKTARKKAKSSVAQLDGIKKAIDDKIPYAGPESQRELLQIKQRIVDAIERVSPEYKAARKVYEAQSKPLDRFLASLTGKAEKLSGEDTRKIYKIFFAEGIHPDAIKRAKVYIQKQNPEAWDGIVRGYLQETLEKVAESISDRTKANITFGGKFSGGKGGVFNTAWKRNRLKAALSMGQYKALGDLMSVLDDTVRAIDWNSDTAFKIKADELIRQAAGGRTAAVLRKMTISGPALAAEIEKLKQPAYAAAMAEALLDPKNYKKLARLKQLGPGTEKAIRTGVLLSTIWASPGMPVEGGGTKPIGTFEQ